MREAGQWKAASWSPASCGRLYREGDSVDSRVATPDCVVVACTGLVDRQSSNFKEVLLVAQGMHS